MRKVLLVLVIATSMLGIAQEPKPLADAGITTCEESTAGGGQSKWIQSKASFAAAVELRAIVTSNGKKRNCTTSWILHVRGQGGDPQAITVAERLDVPEDNEWLQENSFDLIAWSSDGKLVLTAQAEAQGDWDVTTPIVYDFGTGRYFRVELQPLIKKLIASDCDVVYRPLRFASDGTVILSAVSTDDDREAGTKPCFGTSLWQLDFRHKTIRRFSPVTHSPR